MKKKICVLGASSFVATNILKELGNTYEIFAFSRGINKHKLPVHWFQLSPDKWAVKLKKILQDENIISVIFCSGATNLNRKDFSFIYNFLLEEVLKSLNANTKFIFFSAGSVERDKSQFALMNLEAEKKIREHNVQSLILRPSVIYGPYDRKNLAFILKLSRFPIIPLPMKNQVILQPVFVNDIVKFIFSYIEGKVRSGTFTLAGPEKVDLIEIVKKGSEILGRDPKILPINLLFIKKLAAIIPFLPKEEILHSGEKSQWDNTEFVKALGSLTPFDEGLTITLKQK